MTEILTESFCERCGTRYTFESAVPSQRRLTGLKVLGRGLKNFVMSDDASLDEAMSAARSDVDRDATNHQLDAFHRTFSFCMSCRQYTCANCWNETEARCLSCEPLAIDPAAGAGPDIDIDIDPARLLRLLGGANGARPGHEHVDAVIPAEHEHAHEPAEAPSLLMSEQFVGQTEAPAEHEDVEAPAASVQDAWPTSPAAPVAWPEGFVGSPAPDEPEAALAASADSVDDPAVDVAPAVEVAPTLADGSAEAPAETAPVEWWARAELIPEHQAVAAEAPALPDGPSAPIASQPEVAAVEPMAVEPEAAAELEIAAVGPVAAEPEVAALEPVVEGATLSYALAEYEAAFSAPIPEPDTTEASSLPPVEGRYQAAAADVPAADLPAADLPAAELPIPAPEALAEPILSEPGPQAVVEATPAAEIAEPAAFAEPAAATPATAPDAPAAPTAEPPAPTDHVAQPVWRAPSDPASPAPQWPTGPRWPTGLPTGGAPSPLPPPVDALAALMARTSTEAMWAASSQEILQPASATPAIAAIQSCGNCGISLSATARFCRRCGTPQG